MKKIAAIILAIMILAGLTACNSSGISQEEYDSVINELNELKSATNDSDNSIGAVTQEEYDNIVKELNEMKNRNDNNTNEIFRPKVYEFPACKAAATGWKKDISGTFVIWGTWMSTDEINSPFASPDFLCYDEQMGFNWIRLLQDTPEDAKGFEIIDFSGGLYVSAIARNNDMDDMDKTIENLMNWVNGHDNFELDFSPGRYQMSRRFTSNEGIDIWEKYLYSGHGQLEMFIPIKVK